MIQSQPLVNRTTAHKREFVGCFLFTNPLNSGHKNLKRKEKTMTGQEKIYQMVTDQILEQLDKGVVPWDRGWNFYKGSTPVNLISNKAYRGINVLLLGLQGFESPYWLTFNQAKKIKARLRKGSKSTTVIFWKWTKGKRENDSGENEEFAYALLRYYRVFNIDQFEEIDHKRVRELRELQEADETECFDPIDCCEKVWAGCLNKPELREEHDQACYDPKDDYINMPKRAAFKDGPVYYATLFHELAHSTGHEDRLARCDWGWFGSETYSKEELTAELTAAFLMATCGVEGTQMRSAAYLKGWSEKLREDRKMIVQAAARAQKAADYILNLEPLKAEE
jgi:antirestriction protein ArdC